MSNIPTWAAIPNSFSHPCAVVDVLSDEWDREFVNTLLDVWPIASRDDVLIDSLKAIAVGVGVDMLADVEVAVVIALEFAMPAPLKEWLLCSAAFACWPTAILDCGRALHVLMPSYHVWSRFVLPAPPQFLNQEPPWPQQLLLSDFPMVPHLGHTELAIVVVMAGVCMWALVKGTKRKTLWWSIVTG